MAAQMQSQKTKDPESKRSSTTMSQNKQTNRNTTIHKKESLDAPERAKQAIIYDDGLCPVDGKVYQGWVTGLPESPKLLVL